jgi:hypothetical protein
MEELDLLKKEWQKTGNYQPVSEVDIYRMLHKKSSSVVRWILVISVLELLIFRGLDFFILLFDSKEILILKQIELYDFETILTFVNVLILLIFIYFLYKNYVKIDNDSAVKQLMENILKTRKIVQYYVNYNLVMIVFTFLFTFYKLIISGKFIKNPMIVSNLNSGFVYLTLFIGVLIVLGFFWLFYKLLYGILLKKLKNNYTELLKIDL